MGYTLEEGIWINPDMEENLQNILDSEVTKYYTELTVRIAISYGKSKFYTWWTSITDVVVENVDEHWNDLTIKYREYRNERSRTN